MTDKRSISSNTIGDQPGNAFRSAIVLRLAVGFNFVSTVRQANQSGNWQAIAEAGVILLFLIAILVSIALIRRQQVQSGLSLLLTSFLITIALRNGLTAGMGILFGVVAFTITSAVAFYTLSPRQAIRIAAIGLLVGILLVLFDLYAPPYRQTAALASLYYVALAVILVFILLMGWKVWQLRHVLFRWSLTTKLLVPIIGFFAIVTGGLIAFYVIQSANAESAQEAEEEAQLYQIFTNRLQSLETLAMVISTDAVNNREVVETFAAKDRERLVALTLPIFINLRDQFGVAQYHFIEPPATSFVRLHQLENYGDDLSSFRATVVLANQEQRPVKGLEFGRGGLGMRGEVPIFSDGLYLGILDIGMDVRQNLMEELKARTNTDWQLMVTRSTVEATNYEPAEEIYPVENLLLYASSLPAPIAAPETAYQRVLNGENVVSHIEGEKHLVIYSFPLKDYSGSIIGVLDAVADRTAAEALQNRGVMTSALLLVMAFVIGGFILAGLSGSILRPLTSLTENATAVAGGDLSRTVEISKGHKDDELGILASAFNTMTVQLRELIGTLEQKVVDRTRALEASSQVSRRLSTIMDQQQLLISVVEELRAAFNYYHAHIYLLNEVGDELVLSGGTGEAAQVMLSQKHKVAIGKGLVGRAALSRQVVLVPDTSQDPEWLPNPLLPETKAEAAVPIAIGERVIGVLDVQQNIVNGLGEQDVQLLQSIASQVAIAVQNARVYTLSQQQAERETLINQIGRRIQSGRSIDDVLRVAVEELWRSMGAQQATIQIKAPVGDDNPRTEQVR